MGCSTYMDHGVWESLPEFLVKPVVKSVAVIGKVKRSESQRLSHCSPPVQPSSPKDNYSKSNNIFIDL